jgi:hypothetical protein
MALALEGTPVHKNVTSGSTIVMDAFTTSVGTQVVIVATINGGDNMITSITGGSLTFSERSQVGSSGNNIYLWTAEASGALAGVQFTLNLSTAIVFGTVDVFAFSGQDTGTIFDGNASIPAEATSDPVLVSTTTADTVIIAGMRVGTASPTQGTGFTKISGADFQLTQYKIVAAPQTNLSVDSSASDANGVVVDAIKIAGAGGGSTLLLVAKDMANITDMKDMRG